MRNLEHDRDTNKSNERQNGGKYNTSSSLETEKWDEVLTLLQASKGTGRHCDVFFSYIDHYPRTDDGQIYCNSTWDSLTCWPTTLANTTSYVPCPEYYLGRPLEKANVTRFCDSNGTWAPKSNYGQCLSSKTEIETHNNILVMIYNVGYGMSTVSLLLSLVILLYFRNLRCLRNQIHSNLMGTFIIRNIVWMTLYWLLYKTGKDAPLVFCKALVTIFHYTCLSNFFWMLVEGMYLHLMIVWAFSVDKFRLWHFIIIGWCIPLVIILVWIPVKIHYENIGNWMPTGAMDTIDQIIFSPILLVLFMNIIFLCSIVYVLLTKLRASTSMQTSQYRKAVTASLFLLPLLGLTYILFLVPPSNDHNVKIVFKYGNGLLQSTQGLFISIFYCFLNREVRATIRSRIFRWKDSRSFSTKMTRALSMTRYSVQLQNNTEVSNIDKLESLNKEQGGIPLLQQEDNNMNTIDDNTKI